LSAKIANKKSFVWIAFQANIKRTEKTPFLTSTTSESLELAIKTNKSQSFKESDGKISLVKTA